MSGSDPQTQMVIDAGVLSALPKLMRHPKPSIQKDAAWAVSNIAAGPPQQIQQLITCGLLPPLVNLLRNVGGDLHTFIRVIIEWNVFKLLITQLSFEVVDYQLVQFQMQLSECADIAAFTMPSQGLC